MSNLNVNNIQPVGSGLTITVNASQINASSSTVSASSFVGPLTGDVTGSGANLTNIPAGQLTGELSIPAGLVSIQTFTTAGSYTWTKPSGIKRVRVFVTGGGGGGGSHNTDDAQGGGGAGGTAIKIIDVTSVSSVSVTIGGGGTGSVGDDNNGGNAGGTSSFGSYCSATGGGKPENWAIGGVPGEGIGGDINLLGGGGICGNIDGGNNEESGGTGGSSYWGGGNHGGSYWLARDENAGAPGSGGGGTHASTNNAGSAGMPGIVVVEEYR